ncbi:hypothetical protein B0H13DRAFT_2364148 [Mycena leptocephala]|nr:hypothetical protein B0H13DRAFT_2364148 [Mycena leptocephala]
MVYFLSQLRLSSAVYAKPIFFDSDGTSYQYNIPGTTRDGIFVTGRVAAVKMRPTPSNGPVINTIFLEEDVSVYTDIHQSQVDILQKIIASDGKKLGVVGREEHLIDKWTAPAADPASCIYDSGGPRNDKYIVVQHTELSDLHRAEINVGDKVVMICTLHRRDHCNDRFSSTVYGILARSAVVV